jgi:hypothetical protein
MIIFLFLHTGGFYKVDSNLPPLKMFIRREEKKNFCFRVTLFIRHFFFPFCNCLVKKHIQKKENFRANRLGVLNADDRREIKK